MQVEADSYIVNYPKVEAMAMFNFATKNYYKLKSSLYTLCHSFGVEEKFLQEIDQELLKRLDLSSTKRRYYQVVDKTAYYKMKFKNHCAELSVHHFVHKVESQEELFFTDYFAIAKTAFVAMKVLEFIEKNNK